jgi:starvation-inducible DNA-binding protein
MALERRVAMAPAVLEREPLFLTRNNLPVTARSQLIALLNKRLADCLDLQLQAKVAHWNVKGMNFIGLHELFDRVYASVADYADLIAERAVQLGGVAQGTARIVAMRSGLDEYPTHIAVERHHVEALSGALAAFGAAARRAIDEAVNLGDAGTADLFTEVSRGIDKSLWLVEAHLQSELA